MISHSNHTPVRVDPNDDPLKTMWFLKGMYIHIFRTLEISNEQEVSLVADYKKSVLTHLTNKFGFTPQSAVGVIHLSDLTYGFRIVTSSDPDRRLDHCEISVKRLPNAEKFGLYYQNAVRSFVNVSKSLELNVAFCENQESYTCVASGIFERYNNHRVTVEMSMSKSDSAVFRRQYR